jgi:NADH:ubiquinone oxidoreductase subunit K
MELLIISIMLIVTSLILLLIKKNFILLLFSLELLALGVNLYWIFTSILCDDMMGQLVSVILITTASVIVQ